MRQIILATLVVISAVSVVFADGNYTPVSIEGTNTLQNKTLTDAGSITFDSDVVIDGDATNSFSATLSATGADAGNLRVISGEAATADGDDIGMQFVATDTGGTAEVYLDINVDCTDADDGTTDATVQFKIPVAGTDSNMLVMDSSGIDVEGDVVGNEIGGITAANLVDKSATETIAGAWTHTGAVTVEDSIAATVGTGQTNASFATITTATGKDVSTVFTFSGPTAACIGEDASTYQTNAAKLTVEINGTNYYIGLFL